MESEDATETEALLSAAEQGQAGTGKFFYFSTFVQAALIVHELHLLDIASLRQVPPFPLTSDPFKINDCSCILLLSTACCCSICHKVLPPAKAGQECLSAA